MFLDIAGYGLFENAGALAQAAGKVALCGLGVLLGVFVLAFFILIGLPAIAVYSVQKGVRYRSVPRTIGTFFRLGGLLFGMVIAAVFASVALLLNVKVAIVVGVSAGIAFIGFLVGRAISGLIGYRLSRYGFYMRTFDILRGKIVRLVYSA
jgi:hypothetical protein